jgi:hypothetical protein
MGVQITTSKNYTEFATARTKIYKHSIYFEMPMSMSTISKVVLIPNEYKERLRGYFNPELARTNTTTTVVVPAPQFRKPSIYVTGPDGVEDEIWSPASANDYTFHRSESESSDDGGSTYSGRSLVEEPSELDIRSVAGLHREKRGLAKF